MPRLSATHIFICSGVILGCLILGAVYTSAQTSGITGKITDSVGAVITGAEIKAVISSSDQSAPPQTFIAVSDNEGEFTIPALPFGFYGVEVSAPGFTTLNMRVIVDGRKLTRVDLQLTPREVCGDAKGPNIDLSETDRAEIINQVLKMEIPRWHPDEEPILLSNENIEAAWVSAPQGRAIIVLSTREIINKARPGEHIYYCHFTKFKVHGDCVAITLIRTGVTSEGEGCGLCSSGATYVIRKEAGNWKGKFFSGWIS
jgi:hypothetical protein